MTIASACLVAALPLGGCFETDIPWRPLSESTTPLAQGIYAFNYRASEKLIFTIVGNHYRLMKPGGDIWNEIPIYLTLIVSSQSIYMMSLEKQSKWESLLVVVKKISFV